MRDSFQIVAQGVTNEVSMTLSKANTTFDALATRMSEFLPTPFAEHIPELLKPLKKKSILGKRPSTPAGSDVMSGVEM